MRRQDTRLLLNLECITSEIHFKHYAALLYVFLRNMFSVQYYSDSSSVCSFIPNSEIRSVFAMNEPRKSSVNFGLHGRLQISDAIPGSGCLVHSGEACGEAVTISSSRYVQGE